MKLFLVLALIGAASAASTFKKYKPVNMYADYCQDTEAEIRCDRNTFIFIKSVRWGYEADQAESCPMMANPLTGSVESNAVGCKLKDAEARDEAKKAVNKICGKKKCCRFDVTSDLLGNSQCAGINKVLTVEYQCKLRQRTICENTTGVLKCPPSKVLDINSATWGRKNSWGCRKNMEGEYYYEDPKNAPEMNPSTECKLNIKSIIKNKCNGVNKCYVTADNSEFDDENPCPGIFKFARVAYACIPGEHYEKQTANVCEHDNYTINCGPGKRIKILKAKYGRYDSETCPGPMGAAGMANTECDHFAAKEVKALCNWQEGPCTVPATNSFLNNNVDPCPGTDKYLDLRWTCMDIEEV